MHLFAQGDGLVPAGLHMRNTGFRQGINCNPGAVVWHRIGRKQLAYLFQHLFPSDQKAYTNRRQRECFG